MMAAGKVALLAAAMLTMAASDGEVDRRLASFKAGGWDPLTVPVEWYAPRTVAIAGAPCVQARGAPTAPLAGPLDRAATLAEAGGAAAFIVAQDDRIVTERYWRGANAQTSFNPQSMAKTLVALLVGIAIDRGEIAAVDTPIGRHIAEWRDDARGTITIEQLLQMSSGLAQVDGGKGMALTVDNPAVRQYFGGDFDGPMLALALTAKPGATFDYNNNATKVVARILENASGKSYARLLSERLWQPLGLNDASIYADLNGRTMVSCCVFSKARDWVPIGRLIAGRGKIDGRQLVSARWIDAMLAPSRAYRGYGYQIWLGDQQVGGPPLLPIVMPWQSARFAARDIVFLNGFGGQRVWILPSANLVVVRMGNSWPTNWDDAAIPNLLSAADGW